MVTNRQLKKMDSWDLFKTIMASMENARLDSLIECRWSVEDHEGCDTAWMLRVVCLEQTGERTQPFADALALLVAGHAPRGATPWPDAAEELLARRGIDPGCVTRCAYATQEGSDGG